MKLDNIIKKSLAVVLLSTLTLTACQKKEFEPPNKTNKVTGSAQDIIPTGKATEMIGFSDKMAKVWENDAFLVSLNGVQLDNSGVNKPGYASSQWIMTYFSPKKDVMHNTYSITFDGKGNSTWLESHQNYTAKNNVSNFAIDSDKAIADAIKSGLPEGSNYTLELYKNDKGLYWVIGSKTDDPAAKYAIKKIDALNGQMVN